MKHMKEFFEKTFGRPPLNRFECFCCHLATSSVRSRPCLEGGLNFKGSRIVMAYDQTKAAALAAVQALALRVIADRLKGEGFQEPFSN